MVNLKYHVEYLAINLTVAALVQFWFIEAEDITVAL